MATCHQYSEQLIACLIKLEHNDPAARTDAKMEMMTINSRLMPSGNPDFKSIRHYTPVVKLAEQIGKKNMLRVLSLLVKDFCSSLNVVRNMNDDQMLEAAGMLYDECDTFRLEDYQMMFTLGKRGHLVRILDRVDINVITQMMDAYWSMRDTAGKKIQEEEFKQHEREWNENTSGDIMTEQFGQLVGIMTAWDEEEQQKKSEEAAKKRKSRQDDIEKRARDYAEKQGVNYDEVLKQFKKEKGVG